MLKNILKTSVFAALCFCAVQLPAQDKTRYLESEIARLRQMVSALQDENANYQNAVAELRRQQQELARDNQKLHDELRQIRELVRSDAAARDAQLRKLSEQLEKLANMPAPAPAPVPQASGSGPEEFEVYIVQPGATLSEIARVYEVTVKEIKRANNLKSDMLRIGQKLLIPVKKKK